MDSQGTVSATSGSGTTHLMEQPGPIVLPKFGEWPYFYESALARNGREGGIYLVGCLDTSETKCGHVVLTCDHVEGALHVLVEHGYQVAAYSSSESQRTFEVRSIHYSFVEPSE